MASSIKMKRVITRSMKKKGIATRSKANTYFPKKKNGVKKGTSQKKVPQKLRLHKKRPQKIRPPLMCGSCGLRKVPPKSSEMSLKEEVAVNFTCNTCGLKFIHCSLGSKAFHREHKLCFSCCNFEFCGGSQCLNIIK